MFNQYMTAAEKERIAYVNGDTALAKALEGSVDAMQLDDNIGNASAHIADAKASIPAEDFLQNFIDKLKNRAKNRVTKEDMLHLAAELEELQSELAGTFEYMHSELKKADIALYEEPIFQPSKLTY